MLLIEKLKVKPYHFIDLATMVKARLAYPLAKSVDSVDDLNSKYNGRFSGHRHQRCLGSLRCFDAKFRHAHILPFGFYILHRSMLAL